MAKFSDNSMASVIWDESLVIAVGALIGDATAIDTSRIDSARLQGFRILRTEYFMGVRAMTTGEGPIVIGMAHDLTAGEITAGTGGDPQRPNDPTQSELANRPIFPLEVLMPNADGDGKITAQGVKKLNWSFQEGTSLIWYAQNISNQTLTTGAIVLIQAKHFGVWLKD